MKERNYILPTDDEENRIAALLVVNDEAARWLCTAREAFGRLHLETPNVMFIQYGGPGMLWEARPIRFFAMDEDLEEAVFDEGCNVMLGLPLYQAAYEYVGYSAALLFVSGEGVAWEFILPDNSRITTNVLHWAEIGSEIEDLIRCGFEDCAMRHPMAGALELVTCRACRGRKVKK